MSGQVPMRGCLRRWFVVVSLAELALATGLYAQPAREHVFLPPTRGATALSAFIDAQSRLIAAQGDFLESAAIARRHHAAAAAQEIENSVAWVKAYFERKELNRAYRQQYHPNYIQRYEKAQRLKEHLLEERPELATAGDVTADLNFMLDKLSNHALAHQVIFGEPSASERDGRLTQDDIHNLILTDGTGKGSSAVTFRAERGSPLEFDWPLVFQDAGFDSARRRYEAAKQELLDGFTVAGTVDPASWNAIQEAIDALFAELHRQYPPARFENDPQEFMVYNAALRFLKSKASMVFQARITADAVYLTDKYIFDGETVLDLVRHMARHGLRFAPPEGGGKGSYNRLYMMMRQLYLEFFQQKS